MKILLVSRRYWPALGGVESYLREAARGLADRHEVTVLAQRIDDGPADRLTDCIRLPPTFEPFEDGKVRVEPLRISRDHRALLIPLGTQVMPVLRRYAFGRARLGAASLYARAVAPEIAVRAQGAEIVHMFGADLLAVAAMRAARRLGVPGIITPFAHANEWGVGPADALAYRSASRVIALLEANARVYLQLGVPADRITVCGAATPGLAPGEGAAIRDRHEIAGPLVVFLGVRRATKGSDLLLSAAPAVGAAVPGVTFAFVGPGSALPDVPGVRIIDAGPVDETDRAGWLDAADLLCLPSDNESFGLVVIEAWSLRTPVVVSNIPALAELVSKAGGGVVVSRNAQSIAEGVRSLLTDAARRRALGEAGHAYWAKHYTVPALAGRHERLYVEALEESVRDQPALPGVARRTIGLSRNASGGST